MSDLVAVSVWKFDVLLLRQGRNSARITTYVKRAVRGDAFQALFAEWPRAKVFGTGLPLTEQAAEIEVGRPIEQGEVMIVDDLGELAI